MEVMCPQLERTREAARHRSSDLATLLGYADRLVTSLCNRGISPLGSRTNKEEGAGLHIFVTLSFGGRDGYFAHRNNQGKERGNIYCKRCYVLPLYNTEEEAEEEGEEVEGRRG